MRSLEDVGKRPGVWDLLQNSGKTGQVKARAGPPIKETGASSVCVRLAWVGDIRPLSGRRMALKTHIEDVFFFQGFYLFIFRQRGREGERETNINVWLPLVHPLLRNWPEIRHVP